MIPRCGVGTDIGGAGAVLMDGPFVIPVLTREYGERNDCSNET